MQCSISNSYMLMKTMLIYYIILFSSLSIAQSIDFSNDTMPGLKLYNEYNFKEDFYRTNVSRSFWNNNLQFKSTQYTLESSLKVGGEVIAGGLVGYVCAKGLESIFEPDKSKGENWLGILWQAGMVSVGAVFGTSGGTYLFGNILGDDGSFTNTIYWSLISGTAFGLIGAVITDNYKGRLWITAAGLPIGATIGFNSNELFD